MKLITRNNRCDGHRSCSGIMLLEVVIVSVLLASLAAGGVLISNLVTSGYRTGYVSTKLNEAGLNAANKVGASLLAADIDGLTTVVILGGFSPDLNFQVVDLPGTVPASPIQQLFLEPDPGDAIDGIDNDGDGLVDEGRLVWIQNPGVNQLRTVLVNGVARMLEGEIAGNGIDDNANGLVDEPGVAFEFQEGRVIFHLTLERANGGAGVVRQTFRRTFALRNSGALGV